MTKPRQRPHLAAYCLLRDGDKLLMQRRYNTGYLDGHWALPSGFVDDGEDALTAASRELKEETGVLVTPEDWTIVCVMHRSTDFPIIDLFFETAKFVGTPEILEPNKSDGLAFFAMNDLPSPVAGYVNTAIELLKEGHGRRAAFHHEGWSPRKSTDESA